MELGRQSGHGIMFSSPFLINLTWIGYLRPGFSRTKNNSINKGDWPLEVYISINTFVLAVLSAAPFLSSNGSGDLDY